MKNGRAVLPVLLGAMAIPSFASGSQDEEKPLLKFVREVKVGRTPSRLVFSARGQLFVSCAYDTAIEILDKSFEPAGRHRMSPLVPLGLAPLRNGKQLVFANYGADGVHWLDLSKGEVIAEVKVAFKPVSLAVTSDGRTAAVACDQEQEVHFVNLGLKRVIGEPVIVTGRPFGMAFDARGAHLFMACGKPSSTFVKIDVKGRTMGFWDTPVLDRSELVLARNGSLYAAHQDGGILVLDPAGGAVNPEDGGAVLKVVPLERKFHVLELFRRGKSLAVLDTPKKELWVLDTEEWTVQQKIATGDGPEDIAVTRDGKTLVVANRSAGTLGIYQVLR